MPVFPDGDDPEEKRVADDERRWRMKAVEEVLELGLHLCHDGFNDVVV